MPFPTDDSAPSVRSTEPTLICSQEKAEAMSINGSAPARLPSVLLVGLALTGCVHDREPVAVAAAPTPPQPAPSFTYAKSGANQEDLRRAIAGCMMRAEVAEAQGASWPMVYVMCMRADGWVRVQRK